MLMTLLREPSSFSFSFELIYASVLLGVAALVTIAYLLRIRFKGRAHYDRIDRQGGSTLLGKGAMEGAYWFLQPFGRALAALHITPNKVSWASLFFGVLAGACLAVGHFGSGAIFGTISALLDSLDGMVARLTGMSSDAGEVLDASVDRYCEFLFIGGLVIYYREIPVLQLLALLALLGSFMISYSTAKAEALHVTPPKGSMRRPERALYLLLGAALSPITIPWLERVREFPIPIGHPMVVALCLIAVLANVSAVERLWAVAQAVRAREADAKRQALARASAHELGDDEEGDTLPSEVH